MSFTTILPEYLPNVEYFSFFLPCKTVLIADHVQYRKRSSITRKIIAKGEVPLRIPVKHCGHEKPIYQKKIAPTENWNLKHIKSIRHSFNTAPYFDEFFPEIEAILMKPGDQLIGFLLTFILFFVKKFKISARIKQTSELNFHQQLENELIRFAGNENLTEYFYNKHHAESGWINTAQLNNAQIKTIEFPSLKSKKITQMNASDFLFQYGPEAPFILRDLV
jgi:hypothetical protein